MPKSDPARCPFRNYPHAAVPQAPYYNAAAAPPWPFYHAAFVPPPPPPVFGVPVRQAWAHNFDAEMDAVLAFATRARHVSFNVQYPGVVHHQDPAAAPLLTAEKRYAALKADVDELKPLQLGLAVSTDNGLCMAWEFNLLGFDPANDPHAPRSISYLAARGMNLSTHGLHGIPAHRLSMALHHCGLFRLPELSWVTYGGAYHVAYLVKIVTAGRPLPPDIAGFHALVRRFLYGDVYDVARVAGDWPNLPLGLERIAGALGLPPPQVALRYALKFDGFQQKVKKEEKKLRNGGETWTDSDGNLERKDRRSRGKLDRRCNELCKSSLDPGHAR